MGEVLVEFVRPWRGKVPGDTARFAPGVADLLCNVSRAARVIPDVVRVPPSEVTGVTPANSAGEPFAPEPTVEMAGPRRAARGRGK